MGTSVQWYAVETEGSSSFPGCPWAVNFDEKTCFKVTRGDWDWEAGLTRDQIMEIGVYKGLCFQGNLWQSGTS